ncbi:kinase-like protein [Exidia glandulosa HHB12029]|uniref:Kinase-like protein n=1 Tax=Exidia glandulosa HHB12029 TaxID=1314781 RepID=A0A165IPU7_EXIGL|nr:kinase-like protein [Exidia glandulosa HHB12029]
MGPSKAPEIMLSVPLYATSVDIWSTGCVLAEMLEGRPLFPVQNSFQQLEAIMTLLACTPEDVIAMNCTLTLLKFMIVFQPDRRISAVDALTHTFVGDYHDPQDEPVALERITLQYDDDSSFRPQEWRHIILASVQEFHRRLAQQAV